MKPAFAELAEERRRRLTRRALPVVAGLAGAALCAGLLYGALRDTADERAAKAFGAAWERGDYPAMHRLLAPAAQRRTSVPQLERAYRQAATTATASAVDVGGVEQADEGVKVSTAVSTRIFGAVRGDVVLPMEDSQVAWAPQLVFPGLAAGERLTRRTEAPARAKITARDGQTLAEGPATARRSPLGEVAASIAGTTGPPTSPEDREDTYARGFDGAQPIGLNGLERVFEREVAGTPGGVLLAGGRVLAGAPPRPGGTVRSSIVLRVQEAASEALGGQVGGIAALDPLTGEVRALTGIAFSGTQPPGSTFKIITTTAALEAKLVKPSDRFPVETRAIIDGVEVANASNESCGGTFTNSFAHSCNSVFAPLGVRVGAERLVAAAERYGFNRKPRILGAVASTIPPAREIETPLELGASAIGQGKVLATPLQLASAAQVVAAKGLRHEPTLQAGGPRPAPERVTSPEVARELEKLMIDVVDYGTGTSAALESAQVAGKTGTAELGRTKEESASAETDAWFTAYAPTGRPRIAVAVLLVHAGAGGEAAAPAARPVLAAGLRP